MRRSREQSEGTAREIIAREEAEAHRANNAAGALQNHPDHGQFRW